MNKSKLLTDIRLNYKEGCKITTQEIFNNQFIVGDYVFDTLEEYVHFFETEYDYVLVRKVHNTQILSWEFIYAING